MDADVVIVGGGPAGLGAAVTLARSFRDVVVIDEGTVSAHPVRGYLTRDGIGMAEFRERGRGEAVEAGAAIEHDRAGAVCRIGSGSPAFRVSTDGGRSLSCRRVVLATGVTHRLPAVPGLPELWGSLVQNCPYCHDWGPAPAKRALVHGSGSAVLRLAALLTQWAAEVVLLPDAPMSGPLPRGVRTLGGALVAVRRSATGQIEAMTNNDDNVLGDVLFVDPPATPTWQTLDGVPAELTGVALDPTGRSPRDGVWIVGTAASVSHRVVAAAAHGTLAAQAVNASLVAEDHDRSGTGPIREGEVA